MSEEKKLEIPPYILSLLVALVVTAIPTGVTFLGYYWREQQIGGLEWRLVGATLLLQWALCHWLSNKS
jgi:hypothetical protein